eukprot:SAG11_NODE_34541_length_271_cov_0.895349_1_plen_58_part_10
MESDQVYTIIICVYLIQIKSLGKYQPDPPVYMYGRFKILWKNPNWKKHELPWYVKKVN